MLVFVALDLVFQY